MKLFDAIWARIVKIGGFLMGVYIMYHETVIDKGEKPYLYAAAIAMMGLQVAETLDKLLEVVGFLFTSWGAGKKESKRNKDKGDDDDDSPTEA